MEYRITDYDRLYKPLSTKGEDLVTAKFVKLPVKPMGRGLRALLKYKNGIGVFGVWCLLLELATDQKPQNRGRLLNHKDEPASIEEITDSISLDKQIKLIKYALTLLEQIGWVYSVPGTDEVRSEGVAEAELVPPKLKRSEVELKGNEKVKDVISFENSDFWKLYPRKVAKGAAERAWKSLSPDSKLNDEILAAVRWQKEKGVLKGDKFTPHPATWLNAKRWMDIPEHDEERRRAAEKRAGAQRAKDAKAASEHKFEEKRKLEFADKVKKMDETHLFALYNQVPFEHKENLKKLRPDIMEWPK